jgi:hypothetical protein
MQDTFEPIAGLVVENADKEEIVFTKKSVVDNMFQLLFETRIKLEDIDTAVKQKVKPEDYKKIFNYIANELIKYLTAKLLKNKLSGFRSAPKKPLEKNIKLSKSEQFLERKRKKALEKAAKESEEKGGQAEKIGLKEMGREIEEREEERLALEKKRMDQQQSTSEEYERHTYVYQIAFELFAHAVKASAGADNNIDDFCETIKQIGNPDLNKRQVAIGKIASPEKCKLAFDALLAATRDKNVIIPVLSVLSKSGSRRCITPLLNIMKEYPTPKDILFRGPTEKAIGETVRLMNEKEKSSGTKYVFQLCNNPKFEPMLKTISRILIRDVSDSKIREDYFTPTCLKWISLIAEKTAEKKKKTVKVGFINVTKQTDLSKQLGELVTVAKQ